MYTTTTSNANPLELLSATVNTNASFIHECMQYPLIPCLYTTDWLS